MLVGHASSVWVSVRIFVDQKGVSCLFDVSQAYDGVELMDERAACQGGLGAVVCAVSQAAAPFGGAFR